MTGITAEQSGLSTYAESVLYHNGIKTCRIRWPSTNILTIEVDPSRLNQAQALLPVIQQRAGLLVRVELHQPPVTKPDAAAPVDD